MPGGVCQLEDVVLVVRIHDVGKSNVFGMFISLHAQVLVYTRRISGRRDIGVRLVRVVWHETVDADDLLPLPRPGHVRRQLVGQVVADR